MTNLTSAVVNALAVVQAAVDEADPKAVRVWRFDEAPEVLRTLSQNGGDEDWLAVLPPGQTAPIWAAPGTSFGVCDVDEYSLVDGSTVLIGCHA